VLDSEDGSTIHIKIRHISCLWELTFLNSYLQILFIMILHQETWWLVPVIPATGEVEIRRITIPSQSGQKVSETQSQQISQVWWLCLLTQQFRRHMEEDHSPGQPRQKSEPLSEKQTNKQKLKHKG
jgi:hypothetical protein